MATTEILPFATGGSANVETQATYAADPTTSGGFIAGTAASQKLNKVWRQSSFIAAGIANMLVNRGITVADDGNLTALIAEIEAGINAYLNKNVAGNTDVTLSPTLEANYPMINFTGLLTGNINVIFPQRSGSWIIKNSTTGAFNLTLKMSTGATVVIQQGENAEVFSDGTDMQFSSTSGATSAQFDSSMKPASTAFVQRALGNMAGQTSYNASATIALSDAGKSITFTGSTASQTLTLPAIAGMPAGSGYEFLNQATVPVTLKGNSSENIGANTLAGNSLANTLIINPGDSVFIASGTSTWFTIGFASSKQFPSSLAANGYQKLPSGLIIQWGSSTITAGTANTVTFPITFPTACVRALPVPTGTGGTASQYMQPTSITPSQATFNVNAGGPWNYGYIAIGY